MLRGAGTLYHEFLIGCVLGLVFSIFCTFPFVVGSLEKADVLQNWWLAPIAASFAVAFLCLLLNSGRAFVFGIPLAVAIASATAWSIGGGLGFFLGAVLGGAFGSGVAKAMSASIRAKTGEPLVLLTMSIADTRPSTAKWPAMSVSALQRLRRETEARRHPSTPASFAEVSTVDEVDCSVFSPRFVRPHDVFFVQVFLHSREQSLEAVATAKQFDEETEKLGYRTLETKLTAGDRVSFTLHMPGLTIDDPVQHMVWRSRLESIQFGVSVPQDCAVNAVVGTVTIAIESVPVGHIKFKVSLKDDRVPQRAEPVGDQVTPYTHVFISYASPDRDKVLARTQMLKALGIHYFQDVLSLDPGDRWAQKLYRHIDSCDLFLLFWSSEAQKSEWVLREVRYALSRKEGNDFAAPEIVPVIIEGPPPAIPPDDLKHLHFNDPLIYFITAERMQAPTTSSRAF